MWIWHIIMWNVKNSNNNILDTLRWQNKLLFVYWVIWRVIHIVWFQFFRSISMISYYCKNCNIKVEHSECPVCGQRTQMKSELYWCYDCNIPVFESDCPICHSQCQYFTSDARPVFPEERLLIEIIFRKTTGFCKWLCVEWSK